MRDQLQEDRGSSDSACKVLSTGFAMLGCLSRYGYRIFGLGGLKCVRFVIHAWWLQHDSAHSTPGDPASEARSREAE